MVANGFKRCDSLDRRTYIGQMPDVISPLAGWNQWDVLGYLKLRGLPVPATQQRTQMSGITLECRSLLWLHDTYPSDFERIEAVFPYVRSVVARRDFYGVAA